MKQLIIAFLLLFAGNLQAQVEKTTINGKTYYVYPHQIELRMGSYYQSYFNKREVITRDDRNRKVVTIEVEAVPEKDLINYDGTKIKMQKISKEEDSIFQTGDGLSTIRVRLEDDPTPALEKIPDGEYVMFFRDYPYIQNQTLRYKNDVPAAYFTIKNNVLDGTATWYNTSNQLVKTGNYTNGFKEGAFQLFTFEYTWNSNFDFEKTNLESVPEEFFTKTDTILESIAFHDGVKNGKYFRVKQKDTFELGWYTDDKVSGNWKTYNYLNVLEAGEQKIYNQKQKVIGVKNVKYFTPTKKLILTSNYTYNDAKSRGKSVIVRNNPNFEYSYLYSDDKEFFDRDSLLEYIDRLPYFNQFYDYGAAKNVDDLPGEEIRSFEGEEYEGNRYGGDYGGYDMPYNYQGEFSGEKPKTRNEIIDSLGYQFKYTGVFEEYHINGQLKYRFEIKDGKLVEETPFYYFNSQIANEVLFLKDSNQYKENFYDFYGKLVNSIFYDSIGNEIQKENDYQSYKSYFVNGKEFFDNERGPSLSINNEEKWMKNPFEFDTILHNIWIPNKKDAKIFTVSKLDNSFNEQFYDFEGNPVAFRKFTFSEDYSSLQYNAEVNFRNIHLTSIGSGAFENTYIEYRGEKFKKYLDSFPARKMMYNTSYDLSVDRTLDLNKTPFNGKLKFEYRQKKFSFTGKENEISVQIPSSNKDFSMISRLVKTYMETGKKEVNFDLLIGDWMDGSSASNGVINIFGIYNNDLYSYNSNRYDFYKYLETEEKFPTIDNEYYSNYQKPSRLSNRYRKGIDRITEKQKTFSKSAQYSYLNGKKEGDYKVLDTRGNVKEIGMYKNDLLEGENKYFEYANPDFEDIIPNRLKRMKNRLRKKEDYSYERYGNYYDYNEYNKMEETPKKRTNYMSNHAFFKNGRLDGPATQFNWKGDTTNFQVYQLGLKQGAGFEKNSFFTSYTIYDQDQLDGIVKTYFHPNDSINILLYDLNFQDNLLQGESKAYHTNGKLAKKGFFLNGQPIDDYEAYDTLGFKYQYVRFQFNQPVEEKIWEENQLSVRYTFNWKDSIPFYVGDITSAPTVSGLMSQYGIGREEMYRPYYGRPSLVDKKGISYHMTKYYPNDTMARDGEILKGKKVGKWLYYNIQGVKLYEINYADSLLKVNDSLSFNTKGILTYYDTKGTILSKSWIIEKFEKYDCSHTDHTEERMLYCFWEKDSSQHRTNGYVKNYYENGSLQNEGFVKNGLPVGVWKMYDVNGNLHQVGEYQNGKRNGRWIEGDLGAVKNMSEICLNPNLENLEEIMAYQEKLLDISVIYYKVGKELRREYYGINENNAESPEGTNPGYNYYEEGY